MHDVLWEVPVGKSEQKWIMGWKLSAESFLLLRRNQEYSHNPFCLPRRPGLFTKSWPQVARIKAFQWGCLLLSSLFSAPFSFILLKKRLLVHAWFLKVWWDYGCYSECWSLKEIFLSPSLWVRKFWTQEDPFKAWWSASERQQYVHSWQTEICLDSEHSHPLSKHQLSY